MTGGRRPHQANWSGDVHCRCAPMRRGVSLASPRSNQRRLPPSRWRPEARRRWPPRRPLGREVHARGSSISFASGQTVPARSCFSHRPRAGLRSRLGLSSFSPCLDARPLTPPRSGLHRRCGAVADSTLAPRRPVAIGHMRRGLRLLHFSRLRAVVPPVMRISKPARYLSEPDACASVPAVFSRLLRR